MKLLIALCLLLSSSFVMLQDVVNYKVYSMVWSCKYYTKQSKEVKTFFFAIPMTFNTAMSVDYVNNRLDITFQNLKPGVALYKELKENVIIAQSSDKSFFREMLTFSEDFKNISVDLNLAKDKFAVGIVDDINYAYAKSTRVKFVEPGSTDKRALYVTFDFVKKETPERDYQRFVKYLNSFKATTNEVNSAFLDYLE